jgi:hypothetical protein
LPNWVIIFKGVDSLGYFDCLWDLLSCLISFHLIWSFWGQPNINLGPPKKPCPKEIFSSSL